MIGCAVTITGADDDVQPEAMVRLSRMHPRLEWGLLCSDSRAGTPRYPSLAWVRAARWRLTVQGLPMAGHLCGAYARTLMRLEDLEIGRLPAELAPTSFRRIQVNGYEGGVRVTLPLVQQPGFEYVLQARDEARLSACAADARGRQCTPCSVLYDVSGGSGVRPTRWPAAPAGVRTGYAGGISPGNVEAVLGELREANGGEWPAWIDMESGVRDARDRLDLAAVVQVLETVDRVCAGESS